MTNTRAWRLCIWSGVGALVLWLGGFVFFAGYQPPPSPNLSAEATRQTILENPNSVRIGLLLTLWGSALFAPYGAALSVGLRRIEGRIAPLTYTQIAFSGALVIEFILPMMWIQSAAFRPDRTTEIVQAYSDAAWLAFIGVVSTVAMQPLIVGIGILTDRNAEPVFPRWAGFFNVMVFIMLIPGGFCVFFKTGPLAWDGVFAWWVPVGIFCTWIGVMTRLMLVDVRRHTRVLGERVPEADPSVPAVSVQAHEALAAEVAELRRQLTGSQPRSDAAAMPAGQV